MDFFFRSLFECIQGFGVPLKMPWPEEDILELIMLPTFWNTSKFHLRKTYSKYLLPTYWIIKKETPVIYPEEGNV